METKVEKQKNRSLIFSRTEVMFIVALILFLAANILDMSIMGYRENNESTTFNYITKMVRYMSYVICIVKIVYENIYKRKQLGFIFVTVFILLLSYLGSSDKTMVLYLLFFVAAVGISSEQVIRVYMFTQGALLSFLVIGSQLGIVQDYVRTGGGRVRHFLGFSWTTTSAILFLFILLQYIFIKKGKLSLIENMIMIGVSSFFYVMTDSRFAFLICGASVVFFWLFNKVIEKGMFVVSLKKYVILLPYLIGFFAIALHFYYNPNSNIYYKLNDLLSDRLRLGQSAIETYGISLVGKPIEWIGFSISENLKGVYNYVDCSYIQIMLNYGLIFMVMILLLYGLLLKNSIENKKYYLTWLVIIILVFSITEPRLCNLTFNPFILLTVTEITERRKYNEQT